jgi:hypothetical protein
MTNCYLEANVATSQFMYPFQAGWIDTPDWLILRDRVTGEFIDGDSCALVDAIEALRHLDTHSVVSDVALVSTHRGPVTMQTRQRPDEVDHATVQLGESGQVAEALARATIHHFYGIDVVDWNRSAQKSELVIHDDVEAFSGKAEDGFTEDLVRAWFILTSMSVPTHVFLAPTARLESNQAEIRGMVKTLRDALTASADQGRELRRNISGDLGIDRDHLTELLNDQKTRLTKSGRKGWIDLANRVRQAMELPASLNPDVVSFGLARDEQE